MKRIAFVTCSSKPGFASDDLATVRLLESAGVEVKALPWDGELDPGMYRDQSFDKVIIRSAWNYHLEPEKFLQWIRKAQTENINLHNAASVVRWNLHKNYLLELSHKGIPIPPTVWVPKGKSESLPALLKEKGWAKAVVKPCISATAYNTFLTAASGAEEHQEKFLALQKQGDLMVQQFMPEVQEEGEWSLIFFNKQFSHAVLKRPKTTDFRVQDNFGGTAAALPAPRIATEQAKQILGLVNEPLLYARVDGIMSGGAFLLMELELIEPVLFLGYDKNAPGNFAKAILQQQANGFRKVKSRQSSFHDRDH